MQFCYAGRGGPHMLKSALMTGSYLTNSKTTSKVNWWVATDNVATLAAFARAT